MSQRGRPSTSSSGSSKKMALPNLAMAGKREEAKSDKPDKTPSGGRGRGRGSRGSGRGQGTPRGARGAGRGGRQEFIQTTGVFSEGIGQDLIKRPREKNDDVSIGPNSRNRQIKKEVDENGGMQVDKGSNQIQSEARSYDALWESDEEADTAALERLLPKTFISDYKKGETLPVVLPASDEKQFINLMHSKAKQEILDEMEEEKMEIEQKEKEERELRKKQKRMQKLAGRDLTHSYSMQAAEVFKRITQDPDESKDDLFVLQLPSAIASLVSLSDKSTDDELPCGSSAADLANPSMDNEKTDVEKLPFGQSIGKLQVYKNGRVVLKINGYSLDVTKTIPTNQKESIILLETTPDNPSSASVQQQPAFGQSVQPGKGRNAIYCMGDVRHHLNVSFDLHTLDQNTQSRQHQQNASASQQQQQAIDPAEAERIRAELETLDKQRTNAMKGLAENWAENKRK
ncbi:hypothetical protein WR25_25109 [Diploscapter pachys]|uniref:DNA-directed RNA polymerase III subunit RPC4 n=1 Tax=Diploscapter pachys TaxID=2018661 RepID=A0A2A2LC51_9BILA|nr:hypothetical protein WR25_25109 [Diploscapter pachys]